MDHINFEFTVDTIGLVILFNILGTAIQYILSYLHDKKKYRWSEGPLKVVNFLMGMIAIMIANKRHPMSKSEADPVPKQWK